MKITKRYLPRDPHKEFVKCSWVDLKELMLAVEDLILSLPSGEEEPTSTVSLHTLIDQHLSGVLMVNGLKQRK